MMYLAGLVSLIKLTAWCTSAGFLVTMANDKDIHKIVKKVWIFKMIKKVKKFNIGNEHATVLGLTQHGKTYGIIKTLDHMNEAILFFNTNETPLKDVKSKWYEAGSSYDIDQLIYALKKGYKVNYIPKPDIEEQEKELKIITDMVYREGRFPFRFVIDEVHLFKGEGKKALIRLASTGLGRGYKAIFCSQRPAMIDNTLLTQSTKHIVFALGLNDASYLKTNGFPSDEIMSRTNQEKYVFIEFDQKEVKGGYTIEK